MSLLWSSPASHVSRTLLSCFSDKRRCSGGSGTSGHRKGKLSIVPGMAFVPQPRPGTGQHPPLCRSASSGIRGSQPSGSGPCADSSTSVPCWGSQPPPARPPGPRQPHIGILGGPCWPRLWVWALTKSRKAACAEEVGLALENVTAQTRRLSWGCQTLRVLTHMATYSALQ